MSDRVLKTNLPTVRDTGPAKMPGLPVLPPTGNAALDVWARQVTEIVQVRDGARGNPWERNVTVREFASAVKVVEKMVPVIEAVTGKGLNGGPISGEASKMIDAFIDSIKNLRVFKDLMTRLDDPRRFDNLPAEIREILLSDLAKEAAKRGAEITRVEKIIQDANRSLAYEVKTITAAVQQAQAGIRSVEWAVAETNLAQAGKITQLVASLGNYYQDGQPGRVMLEQQMTVTADRVAGLYGQYSLKVQAGNVLAGYALAAEERTDGSGVSAFLISADKFAVVLPTYVPPTQTVTARDKNGNIQRDKDGNPITYQQIIPNQVIPQNQGGIPFGIDANGIYFNNNVYMRGLMRVDTGGRTLIDGLRGSIMASSTASSTWSDATARNLIYAALGKGAVAPNNNHLVIGDMVTIGTTAANSVTKHWMGSSWQVPGAVFNGNLLVNGSVAAHKVDTRGLEVKDPWGNVILSSGIPLKLDYITGLGGLATKDSATIGTTVRFADGKVLGAKDFVHKLSKIDTNTITNFMDHAAIGNAYIGNAAVSTLKIEGNAVTVPNVGIGAPGVLPGCYITLSSAGKVMVSANLWMYENNTSNGGAVSSALYVEVVCKNGGTGATLSRSGYCNQHTARARHTTISTVAQFTLNAGYYFFTVEFGVPPGPHDEGSYEVKGGTISVMGSMR